MPVYQLVILIAYIKICDLEALASAVGCNGMSFMVRRAWLYIEACAFFVNMLQFTVFLLNKVYKNNIRTMWATTDDDEEGNDALFLEGIIHKT